jgi:hypothetical protein
MFVCKSGLKILVDISMKIINFQVDISVLRFLSVSQIHYSLNLDNLSSGLGKAVSEMESHAGNSMSHLRRRKEKQEN